jgi:hypothetical protein
VTMPGFTAEASLARTAALWNTEGAVPVAAREARVVPQFCFVQPGGYYATCCVCAPGYGCWCASHRLIHTLM